MRLMSGNVCVTELFQYKKLIYRLSLSVFQRHWYHLDQNYSSITCFYDQMAGISLNKLKTVQEIQTSRNLDAGIEHKVI